MPENEEVGRAFSIYDVNKLLEAAIQSHSRSLFPSLMTYLLTGIRAAASRIRWKQADFDKRAITVGRTRTKSHPECALHRRMVEIPVSSLNITS